MKEMESKTESRYEYRKLQEKRKQMIAPDLFEFAYVPDWYGHLAELERLALPESWKFRKPSRETKNTDTPILERYIHTIFRKQVIDFNSESDPRKADSIFHLENECVCFHTGLYTPQYKGIYGCGDKTVTIRTGYEIIERTIDKYGQFLLPADLEVNTWWTNTGMTDEEVIRNYHAHGECEQFHSEIKTDMDVERLSSGKFGTNELVLELTIPAYNILRMIGQESISRRKTRHKVHRRRLRTVINNMIKPVAVRGIVCSFVAVSVDKTTLKS